MAKKTKCILKKVCHEGYLNVASYDLEFPSFNPTKKVVKATNRELVSQADSILVLLYVPDVDSFLLCQEFRLGVCLNPGQDDPFILECVSGTVGKHDHPDNTASKEVYEETGVKVSNLIKIAVAYKSPGILTEKCHLYYAEVGGVPPTGLYGLGDEEEIKTSLIGRNDVYQLMDEMRIMDGATLIALNWFRAKQSQIFPSIE
ncbi:NUDIX domain-containing protein [Legionella hackeliae]|nr:NUDIX domain-containing protein [Legionella hackeliae]